MVLASRRSLQTFVIAVEAVWLLAATTGAERHDPPGLEVSNAVHYDLSQRLADITAIPPGGGPARKHPLGELPDVPGTTGNPDLVVQSSAAVLAPGAAGGFEGIGLGNYAVDAAPPDTNGAVGLSHYVQWVNEAFAVFDKTTHAMVLGPAAGNTLWQGFGGPCQLYNDGDPIVLYDHIANRWIFSQFAVSQGSPYLQCIAVSQSSDPLGAYYRYSFSYTYLNDYPKFGVWPDAYYATHNMFRWTIFGWSFKGSKACAYDRSRMLQGLSATQQCFSTSTAYGGLLPSDLDGAALPPAGAPNYLLNFGSNKLNLWKLHVDWATPSNSTFTGPTSISVASFSTACGGGTCIPQLGTSQTLDSLADRLMYRLAYRNFGDHESLVVNHSVAAGAVAGVRWYELRNPGGVPQVYQQGTFAPDSVYRWMGSIAMDQSGDIGLGYSVSSASIHPGIRYTGRVPGDALGTLQSETVALVGGGSQNAGLNRWGDYSSMSVDPTDDCTFWYTTEYLQNDGAFNWHTYVTLFKFPDCGSSVAAPNPPASLTATGGIGQVGLSWSASSGATSYTVLRSTTSGSGYSPVASGITATTYVNTGLSAGTYYYVVQAVNSGGPSGNSPEAGACAAPVAPALSATAGNNQVSLTWSASPGAASYDVLRSTTPGSEAFLVNVTGTSYTDATALNGPTYYYVVTALACVNNTSNEVSATPSAVSGPPPPTGLSASQGPGAKKISLSWIGSVGATSYNIYRSPSGAPGSYVKVSTGVTTTSYADTGLANGTTYYYVVTAVSSGGESGFSNGASATTR